VSEFWGFYASRVFGKLDRERARATLKKLKANAVVIEGEGWVYMISPSKKVARFSDVVLHYFDHEGSAWDFDLYLKGKRIGGGTFGVNGETGAHDQGFDGDIAATAKALGVDARKLERTFTDDSKKFLKLLGLEFHGGPENEVGKGVRFLDEFEDD
jgi:hypothetical protein